MLLTRLTLLCGFMKHKREIIEQRISKENIWIIPFNFYMIYVNLKIKRFHNINCFGILTFFRSLLLFVESRWTLQILLNIAPYANVNPKVSIQVPNPHATGNVVGLTKLPSNPKKIVMLLTFLIESYLYIAQNGLV